MTLFIAIALTASMSGCVGASSGLPERVTVLPGEFYEVNLLMDANDPIEWIWEATGPVTFNVHTHFDGQVQVHQEDSSTSGSGTYQADQGGVHSLLWRNGGDGPVTLEFTLEGAFAVHSMYPPDGAV